MERSTPSCVALPEVKTPLVVLSVMVFATLLAGCASSGTTGTTDNARESNIVLRVGSSAPYDLCTHCGVLSATINGQVF